MNRFIILLVKVGSKLYNIFAQFGVLEDKMAVGRLAAPSGSARFVNFWHSNDTFVGVVAL